jgi:hypothetical protein
MIRGGHDIDKVLQDWPFEEHRLRLRVVEASDGREVIQIRVELGVLQLETVGRPDGMDPEGCTSYLDHLYNLDSQSKDSLRLTEEQCLETDREFLLYHYRRMCWDALGHGEEAMADLNHALSLLEFVQSRVQESPWIESHRQQCLEAVYRRVRGIVRKSLRAGRTDRAVQDLNDGIDRLKSLRVPAGDGPTSESRHVLLYAEKLLRLRQKLEDNVATPLDLEAQLAEAIKEERYEVAAQLRDRIQLSARIQDVSER